MPTLSGKTIFVSGASRGIGLAIALRAAQDGANVALIAKTAEPHPKLEGTVYTAAEADRGGRRAGAADRRRHPRGGAGRGRGGADRRPLRRHRHRDQQRERDQPRRHRGAGDEALRPDAGHQHARHLRRLQALRPASAPGRQPARAHALPAASLDPKWAKSHVGYTLAKYGMSLCTLGMAEEFRDDGIAFNSLWPRTHRRHRRRAEPAGRRRGDGQVAQARGGGRLRVRDPHPALARVHRQLLPVRGRAGRGGGHRPRPVLRGATTSELQVDLFVEQ